MDLNEETFAVFLKRSRMDLGLTQIGLARRMLDWRGIDIRECICLVEPEARRLSHWENGDSLPGFQDVMVLKNVLGCEYEDMFRFQR